MRKMIFFVLLSMFFTFQAHAQEAASQEGWTPKWSVGDWWVVELDYDASAFSPAARILESDPQTAIVKYSIVAEEDLDGERVLKFEIRKVNRPRGFGGLENYICDLWVSKGNLFIRKIKNHEEETADEYIYDKTSHGAYDSACAFNLHAFPIFPLPDSKNKQQQKVKFKRKTFVQGEWREYENWEWGGQTSEPIDLASLLQDERINKEFLQGSIYKVAINGNEVIQYWSKDLPWWVYYEEDGVKGYLREYHISAGK